MMYSRFLFFLVPAVLLIVAALVAVLWERGKSASRYAPAGNGAAGGSFRAFYHSLWALALWCGLSLSLPFWISYKQIISATALHDRWLPIGKVLVFPAVILLLLWYGGRRGYLSWIESPEWPDKENQ
jgi:hypothetical protein